MKKTFKNEDDLIRALKNKDNLAFSQLYDMYSGALLGVISRILGKSELAEDTLQEAFVKIWLSVANYDNNKGRLFTWLLNVARNLAIDRTRTAHWRALHRIQDLEENTHLIDAQKNVKFNIEKIGVKAMINHLPHDQYTILDLTIFKGYTHVEAAEYLDWPVGTVKTKIRYAINALRKIYNPDYPNSI